MTHLTKVEQIALLIDIAKEFVLRHEQFETSIATGERASIDEGEMFWWHREERFAKQFKTILTNL